MDWFKLMLYFTSLTIVLMVIFEVYARLLYRIVCLPRPLRMSLAPLLHCVVVIGAMLCLPLSGLCLVLESLQRSDLLYVGKLGCSMSILIAALFFFFRHYITLKSLGYYQR
jgi:hypothetical protein